MAIFNLNVGIKYRIWNLVRILKFLVFMNLKQDKFTFILEAIIIGTWKIVFKYLMNMLIMFGDNSIIYMC